VEEGKQSDQMMISIAVIVLITIIIAANTLCKALGSRGWRKVHYFDSFNNPNEPNLRYKHHNLFSSKDSNIIKTSTTLLLLLLLLNIS